MSEIQRDVETKFDSCNEDERKRPFFYNAMGLVTFMPKGNLYYNACPGEKCAKKLVEGDDGRWSCEKCGGTFNQPKAKFIANVKITDHTTSVYATVNSDKVGEKVYGKTAQWIRNACEGDSMIDTEALFEDLKELVMVEYYFTIMVKQEYWNGNFNTKFYLIDAEKPEENLPKFIKILEENNAAYDKVKSN